MDLLKETGARGSSRRSTGRAARRSRGGGTVNHVRRLYEPFTAEQISARITKLVRPAKIEWQGEIEIIFQTIENLRAAVPNHTGDWYFSGHYPTEGGYRVVNQAYVNYYEKNEGRSY